MYIHPDQQLEALDELFRVLDEYPFGTLVTAASGLIATHMPFVLIGDDSEFGTLLCHTPRNDPIWRTFTGANAALVIFMGPYAYISPNWYAEKTMTAPTYNFKAAHAYGYPEIIDDEGSVIEMPRELIARREHYSGTGWPFETMNPDYLKLLRPAIVPFRMTIKKIEGKIRVGQHKSIVDRKSTIEGLRSRGRGLDHEVADMMENGPIAADAPKPLLKRIPEDLIGGEGRNPLND